MPASSYPQRKMKPIIDTQMIKGFKKNPNNYKKKSQ
jgi:hypothetical protein